MGFATQLRNPQIPILVAEVMLSRTGCNHNG
jgi:hypothetical protein